MADPAVDVVVQIAGEDVPAGRLWPHRRGRSQSQSFAYADAYLARADAYPLDPALPLASGQFHTAAGRTMFGAFSDCAPDRWGRRLIDCLERHRVQREDGAARSAGAPDYLLGVRDDLRQGALRFRRGAGPFLADEDSGVPPLLELPHLLGAAERLERDEASEAELTTLLRAGSSLGGARPKAHVVDAAGRVAIAKFPSAAHDDWDVMAWEAITLELARQAGITVPDSRLHHIADRSVHVIRRFDRVGDRRIGYVSAMTMLEADDGGPGGSYLEIAEVIENHSPHATRDLHELWRRIAFTVLVSNFDDHLRNHGFLRVSSAGWSLAPAFDINPDPRPGPRELSTRIGLDDPGASIDTLMDVAEAFRLRAPEALQILREVSAATGRWRDVAPRVGTAVGGMTPSALDQLAPAFEHPEAERARALLRAT